MPPNPKTRAALFHSGVQSEDLFDPHVAISEILSKAHAKQVPAVIVIENIDQDWEDQLNEKLHIEAAFFREHKRNPTEEDLWSAAFSSSQGGQRSVVEQETIAGTRQFWHVDGVFEWKPVGLTKGEVRPAVKDPNFRRRRHEPISSSKNEWQQWNTCISHCDVLDQNLCSYLNSVHPRATFALAIF